MEIDEMSNSSLRDTVNKAMGVDRFSNVSGAAIDHMVEAAEAWMEAQVQPDLFQTLEQALVRAIDIHGDGHASLYIDVAHPKFKPIVALLGSAVMLYEAKRDPDAHKQEQPEPDRPLPAVAGSLQCSLNEFKHRATVLLQVQERSIAPDNTLVAFFCDAVRLAREYGDYRDKNAHYLLDDLAQAAPPPPPSREYVSAFPIPGDYMSGGMSMREYFAGQALTGCIANKHCYPETTYEVIANRAFAMADAMIAEQNKHHAELAAAEGGVK